MSSPSCSAAIPAGSRSSATTAKLQLRAVARLYWRHTVFGLLFGIASWLVSPFLALWMLPVTLGLALAVPLAALTARPAGLLRRLGLLAIPEEMAPPAVLTRSNAIRRTLAPQETEAVRRLASDPALLEAHRRMLPPAAPGWIRWTRCCSWRGQGGGGGTSTRRSTGSAVRRRPRCSGTRAAWTACSRSQARGANELPPCVQAPEAGGCCHSRSRRRTGPPQAPAQTPYVSVGAGFRVCVS